MNLKLNASVINSYYDKTYVDSIMAGKTSQVDFIELASVTQAGFTSVNNNVYALSTMVNDGYATLESSIDTLNVSRVSMQSTIANTASSLVYTQNDLTALTTVVSGKADISSLLTASDLIETKASIVALSGINITLTSQMNT